MEKTKNHHGLEKAWGNTKTGRKRKKIINLGKDKEKNTNKREAGPGRKFLKYVCLLCPRAPGMSLVEFVGIHQTGIRQQWHVYQEIQKTRIVNTGCAPYGIH